MNKNGNKGGKALRIVFGCIFLLIGIVMVAACVSASKHVHEVPAGLVLFTLVFLALGVLLLVKWKPDPGKEFWQAQDDKKAARAVKKIGRKYKVEELLEIGKKAPRDDVAAAAFARLAAIDEPRRVEEFAAGKYNDPARRAVALDYVKDGSIILHAATDGPEPLASRAFAKLTDEPAIVEVAVKRKDALAERAIDAIRDQSALALVVSKRGDAAGAKALGLLQDEGLLRTLAADESVSAQNRALAWDKLGCPAEADLLRLPPLGCDAGTRRSAAARILDSGDAQLVEKAVLKVLGALQDGVGKDFLADVGQKYPDVIRNVWPRLCDWSRNRKTHHTDITRNAPHVDSTQYYDFFRYPDGRTVANRNGRKKHTDGPLPSSDCAEYGHTDSTTHEDTEDTAFLAKFPPAIRTDEDGEEA